jgi:glycosyltransferase involved in cell wall biosynthesis
MRELVGTQRAGGGKGMRRPLISVLLCTVRDGQGYIEHPEWHTLEKVVEDLSLQTFKDFELIIIDGVGERQNDDWQRAEVPVIKVPPRHTLWTHNKKVAISTYRNTGLALARGELVVNLDDCCELPPTYLGVFARAWQKHGVCLAMTWPESGDCRPPGVVQVPGAVFGFGSYPLAAALKLNGYDEAYDGGQGLEDVDWSTRLFKLGVKQALFRIPGFKIHAQSAHSPKAIDVADPLAKCCNLAYHTQRMTRDVLVANVESLYNDTAWLERLIGPCRLLQEGTLCGYHGDGRACPYLNLGWVDKRSVLQRQFLEEPENWPIVNLREERKLAGRE